MKAAMIQFLKIILKISLIFLTCFKINAFKFSAKEVQNENLSWSFHSIDSNITYNKNSKVQLSPASTLKVVSMIYAIESLGANFKFKTKVYYSGEIKSGVLYGDIIIVGGSDPYLKHPQLFNMAMSVKNAKIKEVKGRVIYDISSYPEHKLISNFGLGDQTYNPSFGPLNSEFNRHSLWKNKKKNYSSIIPELSIELENSSKLKPTQKFSWKKENNIESWKINKNEKMKTREDIPIRNAGNWSAKLFKYHLKSLGIKIENVEKGILPKSSKLLFVNESLPLWNLISLTMEYSNNLLAETIAIRACQERNIRPLNQLNCSKSIQKYFNKISKEKASLINSSGLSNLNLVNTNSMSEFIKRNFNNTWDGHTLASLLSISGQSGWMRNRLNTPNYNMHVFAKTGSLDFINNITGLIRTRSNKWFSFTVFHTDNKRRSLLNKKESKYLKKLKKEAKEWRKKSIYKIDHLLQSFIDQN
jgi:D-alanyl-D-alanine carboxypeptidase/D-alanyl-D-alanine-endopeptidase (penicillin-binding protein 4)